MANISGSPVPAPASPEPKPKPSLYLDGDQISDAGLEDSQVGDTYTATIKCKITSASEREDGPDGSPSLSRTLTIDSIDDVKASDDNAADDENDEADEADETNDEESAEDKAAGDAEEKTLGYRRPKSTKPSFPVKGLKD